MPPAEPQPAEHPQPQAAFDPPASDDPPAQAPSTAAGPGAPPDAGTLARIVPGILIVMAIGIALLITGILGPGNAPATSDDVEAPALREPVRNQDTTDTLGTPPAPGTEAPTLAD
ncbi:MAG TPA: hypothetical protein VGW11_00705 [Solirubrobacteraceae bacterium]|nr:hypothetical protein [Solirubrobacteraceae bacterium]